MSPVHRMNLMCPNRGVVLLRCMGIFLLFISADVGQQDHHVGAFSQFALNLNTPMMFFGDLFYQIKAETGAAFAVTCLYQDNSGRKDARWRLAVLTENNADQKKRLFEALQNIKTDYLPKVISRAKSSCC